MGTRPSGRPQVSIVFMVSRQSPRHRFNQDRWRRWTWMRYGIRSAAAAIPMPPLPRGVVSPPDRALPIAPLGGLANLASSLRCAAIGAVLVATIAPRADDDPGPATGAGEHSVAVHGGERSPSGTGREGTRSATLLRADVAACRAVCRRKLGGLPHPSAGLPSCTGLMVAAPCSDQPGGEQPRNPAASTFAAVARNQSQELRSRRENQNQLGPPESGGFTPPSTEVAVNTCDTSSKGAGTTSRKLPTAARRRRW